MSFDETDYEDIRLLKNPNNDDLIIACSTQNSVTLKDYFKTGNDAMTTAFQIKWYNGEFTDLGTFVNNKGYADCGYCCKE